MKRTFALLLTLLFCALPALCEDTPADDTSVSLEGEILEITDEGVLLDTPTHGEVLARIDEDTVLDTDGALSVGDYAYADCGGEMTLSLPAQVYATRIASHRIEGDVVESYPEEGAILVQSADGSQTRVNLPERTAEAALEAEHVVVYFDGATTMSIPPQVSAGMVICGYVVQGEITQISDSFLWIGQDADAVQVNFDQGALPEGLAVGDVARVLYNGAMTRSLPPQVHALEIVRLGR